MPTSVSYLAVLKPLIGFVLIAVLTLLTAQAMLGSAAGVAAATAEQTVAAVLRDAQAGAELRGSVGSELDLVAVSDADHLHADIDEQGVVTVIVDLPGSEPLTVTAVPDSAGSYTLATSTR